MSTGPQRARMAAVRSALISLRVHRQHFTIGYGLVVSGGVCAPDTKLESIALTIDNECFDYFDLIPPLPSPSPYAPLGHHLVVSGGAFTPTSPFGLGTARALVNIVFLALDVLCHRERRRRTLEPKPRFTRQFGVVFVVCSVPILAA
ncbi:hypothetical protein CYMTET_15714 [Cymbomonas tetramitiformis]|uniref:Uncharacterized protein n=1 Tax=Cymbomonas tetramitiformis TaxID=36881 RepID=A0AAE0L8W1_9CHLO|nr:hypothetical protein CYMTET_15714 [Cymbomonas tetramitiformis]